MAELQQPARATQTETTLRDTLDIVRKETMLAMNCHAIAKIQSFDPAKQTCTATIAYKRTYYQKKADGTYGPVLVAYPILLDVPVVILGGGGAHLTFPQAKLEGADALILFNDRDIDNWFQGGTDGPVASARLHSFSDGIALVGLRSLANTITDYDADKVVLANDDMKLKLGTKLNVSNSTASLFDALNSALNALQTFMTTASGATPANVAATVGTPAGVAATALTAAITKLQGVME